MIETDRKTNKEMIVRVILHQDFPVTSCAQLQFNNAGLYDTEKRATKEEVV